MESGMKLRKRLSSSIKMEESSEMIAAPVHTTRKSNFKRWTKRGEDFIKEFKMWWIGNQLNTGPTLSGDEDWAIWEAMLRQLRWPTASSKEKCKWNRWLRPRNLTMKKPSNQFHRKVMQTGSKIIEIASLCLWISLQPSRISCWCLSRPASEDYPIKSFSWPKLELKRGRP